MEKLHLGFTFRRNRPSCLSEGSQHSSCCLPCPPAGKAALAPLRVTAGHPGTAGTRWRSPQPSHTTEPSPATPPGRVPVLSLLTPLTFTSMSETSPGCGCAQGWLPPQPAGTMSELVPTGQVAPNAPHLPAPGPPWLHHAVFRNPSEL